MSATVEPSSTSYDPVTKNWKLRIKTQDGTVREMRCHHVVQATGHAGEPRIPAFRGLDVFQGVVAHSSRHTGGKGWTGKKAVVVGSCNSGHDIAQDFYNNGTETTIVQRSETMVVSSQGIVKSLGPSASDDGPPVEVCRGCSFSLGAGCLQTMLIGS